MCLGFGIIFLTCELSQRGSDIFVEINDEANTLDWYMFPDKIQRMLPTILIVTQQPVEFECFGSISCNRGSFKEVNQLKLTQFFKIFIDQNVPNKLNVWYLELPRSEKISTF